MGFLSAGQTRRYELRFDPDPAGPPTTLVQLPDNPFDTALLSTSPATACTSVSMAGNSRITGNVAANAALMMSGNSRITGNATAQPITRSGNARIDGTATQQGGTLNCPLIALSPARQAAEAQNNNASIPPAHLVNGVLTAASNTTITLTSGTYFLQGIKLTGNAKVRTMGPVNIFTTGKVELMGNSRLEMQSGPAAAIFGDGVQPHKLEGNARLTATFYTPPAALEMSGNTILTGRASTKTLTLSGNAKLERP